MTARYATTCRVCSGPVQPGDEITKADQGWAHSPCAATSSDTPKTRARKEMPAAPGALEVWTDGACSGNPGPGGWAWATRDGRRGSGGAVAHHQPADGDPGRAGGGAGAARAR